MTLTWQNGRQLATLVNGNTSISYQYNEEGLRTSKTVNGITTEYYWNGSQLLGQKTGNSSLYFLYDERGLLVGFNDGTKTYLYTRNLQGDIVSITDTATGNTVAEYTYDSWGNVLTATGAMASINPFRYRGYYYDSETGLYYLQSRYYDAEVGRFISADSLISKGILGTNIYAYCSNNPIIKADQSGHIEHFTFGMIDQVRKAREVEEAFHKAFEGNYGFEFQNKLSEEKRFSPSHVTNSVDIIRITRFYYLESQWDRFWNGFSFENSAADIGSLLAEAALEGKISFLSAAEIVIGKLFNTGGPADVIRSGYIVEYFENGKYTYNGGTVQSSYEEGWIYKGVAVYYVGAGVLANGGYEYFEHGYSQYMHQKLISGYLQLGGQIVYVF